MRSYLLLLTSAAALCVQCLSAQMMPGGAGARGQQSYDELKATLNLTDEQVTQLKQLQTDKMTTTQAFYAKMSEKQKELNTAMEATNSDPATVGKLMLDLQQLRKQPQSASDIHEKALAILKPEQKEKLAKLEEAQKMRPAVDQATGLGLLNPPPPPAPRGPAGAPAMPAKAPGH